MAELFSVGKSAYRLDALEKVKGEASFCTDLELPGMLYVKVVRSPIPHGKILSIDTCEAEKLPGVQCIVTGKDAPPIRWGSGVVKDQTVLAQEVVRYAGEPVAAVAAKSIDAAEEAIDLVRVKYSELPAIFDPEEAMIEEPPVVVHPEYLSYSRSRLLDGRFDPKRPNVFNHMVIRRGDVEKGFKEADLVLEDKFSTVAIQHCPIETHSVIARLQADGGFTFWTGRQSLWALKGVIGEVFGIKASKIRVIQQYVGGGFGGKLPVFELIPALLALKTGRPVKWVFTREEEFIDGGAREPMVVYIKDGVRRDGTLLARQMRVILNAGAYENIVGIVTRNCSSGAAGDYRTPNLEWDSYGVYTNEPPRCAFRGFGVTEVLFAIESHMDMLAERLGISPLEIRKRNLLREGEANAFGEITHSIGSEDCLEKVAELIEIDNRTVAVGPWKRGKGIAAANKYSAAPMICGARIQITEDESFILYHGADEIGQGVNTVMAQMVAEEFGVTIGDVRVVFSDTLITPFFADGSTSSRVTYQLGNAVRQACKAAKGILYEKAAVMLGVSSDVLETKDKKIYVKKDPNRSVGISGLFTGYGGKDPSVHGGLALNGEIIGSSTNIHDSAPEDHTTGQIDPLLAAQGKRLFSFYTHVAKAVEIGVNVETGQVRVLRCYAATDLGKMINPKLCEQQSEGGIAMGIGDSIYEHMQVNNGVVANTNFTDYRVVSMADMPCNENVKSFFVETAPHKDGPFGAKGFAEGAMMGMEPAIANAIYDAVGIRIKDIPFTPEKILKALDEKESC